MLNGVSFYFLTPESIILCLIKFHSFIYLSPLLIAIKHGYSEIVEILIHYDIKVNAKKRGELPPILYAIQAISEADNPDEITECVKVLIENNAHVNCSFPDGENAGETPIISASRLNLTDVIPLLIEKKANISAVSQSGKTALYYSVVNKNIDILNALLDANPSFEDLHKTYENGQTLVHLALNRIDQTYQANDALKILELLVDRGLEPDVSDANGDNPLHIAAPKKTSAKIVRFLILHGCDPHQINKKDRTVFSIAHTSIVPVMTETLQEEEAIAAQEERAEYRREKEEEKMYQRRDERDGALTRSFIRDENERQNSINRSAKKHTQLLAMTKRNGTLRTPKSSNSIRTTPITKTEARPWGGSKNAAVFQREMRLKIRRVKKEITDELKELSKAVEKIKKEVYVEMGLIDSDDAEEEIDSDTHDSDSETSIENTLPPPGSNPPPPEPEPEPEPIQEPEEEQQFEPEPEQIFEPEPEQLLDQEPEQQLDQELEQQLDQEPEPEQLVEEEQQPEPLLEQENEAPPAQEEEEEQALPLENENVEPESVPEQTQEVEPGTENTGNNNHTDDDEVITNIIGEQHTEEATGEDSSLNDLLGSDGTLNIGE